MGAYRPINLRKSPCLSKSIVKRTSEFGGRMKSYLFKDDSNESNDISGAVT